MSSPKPFRRVLGHVPPDLKPIQTRQGAVVREGGQERAVSQDSDGRWRYLSPTWYIQYTLHGRQQRTCTHQTDYGDAILWIRENVQNLSAPDSTPAQNLSRSVGSDSSGPTSQKPQSPLPPAALSFLKHVEIYLGDLSSRAGKSHVQAVKTRLHRMKREVPFVTVSDIRSPQVNKWSKRAVDAGESHRNVNAHIHACKAFARWFTDTDVSGVTIKSTGFTIYSEDSDPRRHRRALSIEEFERLISTTRNLGPAGSLRADVYILAARTGLRRAEIASLTIQQIQLGNQPCIHLNASETKNKKDDTLPIDGGLAELLAIHIGDRKKGKLFKSVPRLRTFDQDLKRSGIAKRNDRDLTVDFHSLRKSFVSWLLASGANPRAVQELARHSDLKLTTKTYCSTELLPTRQSLLGLPPMKRAETSDGPGPEAPASGPNAGLSCGLNLNPVALISTQTSESVSKVFDSVREKEGCLKSLSDQTLKQPFSPKELVGARGFEPPASCTPCTIRYRLPDVWLPHGLLEFRSTIAYSKGLSYEVNSDQSK